MKHSSDKYEIYLKTKDNFSKQDFLRQAKAEKFSGHSDTSRNGKYFSKISLFVCVGWAIVSSAKGKKLAYAIVDNAMGMLVTLIQQKMQGKRPN